MEALLQGDAEALTREATDMALMGDASAMRLCMNRLAPARRDRHIVFSMPRVGCAADAVTAQGALIEGGAAGDITPSGRQSWQSLYTVCEGPGASDFEERLAKLERKTSQ